MRSVRYWRMRTALRLRPIRWLILALIVIILVNVYQFRRTPSTKPPFPDQTPAPDSRLLRLIKDKAFSHKHEGDFDRVQHRSFREAVNDLYGQLGEVLFNNSNPNRHQIRRAQWRLYERDGLYHKSSTCKATNAQSLWFGYAKGGFMCDLYDLDALDDHRTMFPNAVAADVTETQAVTLVTHMSDDRFVTLEKTLQHWKGPVSVAVYTSDISSLLTRWHENPVFQQRSNIGMHVLLKRAEELFYPANVLRNLAVNQSLTSHVFLCDVDLVPRTNMDALVMKYVKTQRPKEAFVIPAFEVRKGSTVTDFPDDKRTLLEYTVAKTIQPFLYDIYFPSYEATDYIRWAKSNTSYEVKYRIPFEPYIIIAKDEVPKYHERLVGYHLNKISHLMEVHLRGIQFIVVPDVYVVHMPHPSGKRQLVSHKPCVQYHFTRFLQYLEKTYCISFTNYIVSLIA